MENNPFVLGGTSPPVIAKNFLEILRRQRKPCTEKVLMKMVRGRKQIKVVALRELIKDGVVGRSGLGKKGDPYLYQLTEKAQTQRHDMVVEEIIL